MSAVEITADLLRARPLPEPEAGSKDQRGAILAVAGSAETPGAALLAGVAALRAGAGKLQIATASSAALHLALAVPEAMVIGLAETHDGGVDPAAAETRLARAAERADAVLIGPGMTGGDATTSLTISLCAAASCSVLIDAAAFSELRERADAIRACRGRLVVTPHAGEMARFLDKGREEIEADPLAAAHAAAALLGAVVVMKGAESHVVGPDGQVWIYRGGGVGLATSGSGDVLAGIVAGLLARGADPATAALWGVFVHGEAGTRLADRIGPLGFLAREIAGEAPGILRDVMQEVASA